MPMLKVDTPLSEISGIGPAFLKRLERLGIRTVRDLLFHFPFRYEDFSRVYTIAELEPGQHATIQGTVEDIKDRRSFRRRMTITEAQIADETGTIRAVWFNQPYLKNTIRPGRLANFSGKVSFIEGELYLSQPTHELINSHETRHTARLVPIYPETRGLTSRGLRFLIQPILAHLEPLEEWIPNEVLVTQNFPALTDALQNIHFPNALEDAESARKRFAFEDLFLLQLLNLEQKSTLAKSHAHPLQADIEWLKRVLGALPFTLTESQKRSLWEIAQDLAKPAPMNRLLQGDVGSGKTVIATLAALIAAKEGYQVAFMAPTEVLARQHFETLRKLFAKISSVTNPPHVGLLTGSAAKVLYDASLEADIKRNALHEETRAGKIPIIVGTHALIAGGGKSPPLTFPRLALVVVDEQHRFGVRQRAALLRGDPNVQPSELSEKNRDKIVDKDLSYRLNGICFEIQKEIGRFCRERQYADLLEKKLATNGLNFVREHAIEIAGVKSNFADFLVENRVVIEVKAKPFVTKDDYYQTSRYLQVGNFELGLLVNFQQKFLKPKRVLNPKFGSFGSSTISDRYVPHLLSMSATPIPRTVMLTIFGDLDLSTITELPTGRKPIITKIVDATHRAQAYAFIRGQIKMGRQAFVICPRIDPKNTESELSEKKNEFGTFGWNSKYSDRKTMALQEVASVKEEYEKLSTKIFPDLRVAMLHGQMPSKGGFASLGPPSGGASPLAGRAGGKPSKESVMRDFKDGKIDILVSTSVIEVGVDIPNATVMMIEGSDRFGLAQLYQFRGRVGRGEHQSYCLLFTDSSAKSAEARLKAIVGAKNGFELAEIDLKLRGPGQFLGTEQTGLPDLAMRGLQDIALIKSSRDAAFTIFVRDATLRLFPVLKNKMNDFRRAVHFE